jgi:dihydrofolate synthase / folylpolyglutamate synthase
VSAPGYRQLVEELFPRLTGGIRWGLERTERMLAAVENPHRSFRVVHVGGTNGKGSVAAHIEAALRHAGHRTGLYTSPHLCTFRERVRIDGAAISEADLLAAAAPLWPVIQREEPSFFEATTAIAFRALADAAVDIAVVEVGLGGRLDSTNVVTPDVVVLTNVSLDHVQLLGPTVVDVAREKAGIIKRGVPVVTAEAEGLAADILGAAAKRAQAPLRAVLPTDLEDVSTGLDGTSLVVNGSRWGPLHVHTPLPGRHQAINAAIAVHALGAMPQLALTGTAVVQGMARVRWPGRLQVARAGAVTWVLDVAHNVAGVDALAAAVRELPLPRPLVAVVGVLGDKDWANMLRPIQDVVDEVILTEPPTAPTDRRWNPHAALAAAPAPDTRVVTDFTAALDAAHDAARTAGGTVIVAGSFHTVGDALAALGLCEDGADFAMETPLFLRPA